jgi:hypothetical protein
MINRGPSKLSCGRNIRLYARPLSRQQFVSLSQSSCVSPSNLLRGEGVGVEPSHTTARKPGPLKIIQNSYLLTYSCLHLMARRMYCASSFVLLLLFPSSVLYRNKV